MWKTTTQPFIRHLESRVTDIRSIGIRSIDVKVFSLDSFSPPQVTSALEEISASSLDRCRIMSTVYVECATRKDNHFEDESAIKDIRIFEYF